MRYVILFVLISVGTLQAQVKVDLTNFSRKNGAKASVNGDVVSLSWPAGMGKTGKITLDLSAMHPVFKSIGLQNGNTYHEIATGLDPAFVLTIGKRDLISQNGWNIFFDKVPHKPFKAYNIGFVRQSASVHSVGTRTVINIGVMKCADFSGNLEITLYNGSPLINIAAVMTTEKDSMAILYDAGLISKTAAWNKIGWSDVREQLQSMKPAFGDSAKNVQVKYRTIIGENSNGSLAVFPAPHQYFYPLDEAFNLNFVWAGNHYRKKLTDME